MMNKSIKNLNGILRILIVVLGVLLVIAIAAAVMIGSTNVQLKLQGQTDVTLEFGQSWVDPGAKATMLSGIFGDKDLSVEVSSQVDPEKLGTYTVTYETSYLWFREKTQRTIHIVDTQAPSIVLVYDSNSFTLPGQEYQEEGFVAEDNYDGDITANVKRDVKEDTVYYTVSDSSGNTTQVQRPIKYGDVTAPVLTLKGEATITIKAGSKFTDPGFTATDNVDGDISDKVTVSKDHNTNKAGTYTITYTATDSYGNTATATRTLIVEAAKQPTPVTPEGATIYLTFDDGPGPYTRQLLDVLKQYNVKATFFVCDKGSTYNKIMKDIVDEGHAIAIHSKTHDYQKIYASEEAFFEDLRAMSDIIYQYAGVRTTLMRFPGGSSNGVSKFNPGIMTRLTKMVQEQGYQYFDWNVDSDDAGGTRTSEGVAYNVIHGKETAKGSWRGCEDGKTSIVLQHDIHKYSVEAVEDIIKWGLENGYQFKALDATSPGAHHGVNN